jgi:hypothetical protein
MAPYFAVFRRQWLDDASQRGLADAISRADTVIFETVEREFTFRASDAGLVNPALFRLLRAKLGVRG